MTVDLAYQYLFTGALTVMAVLIGIILIRSIIGPRIIDRILCINMIGTLVICTIAILSQMLDESYLTDIAIIYAMLSFLTVLILASVYIRKLNLTDEDDGMKAGEQPPGVQAFGAQDVSLGQTKETQASVPAAGSLQQDKNSRETVPQREVPHD